MPLTPHLHWLEPHQFVGYPHQQVWQPARRHEGLHAAGDLVHTRGFQQHLNTVLGAQVLGWGVVRIVAAVSAGRGICRQGKRHCADPFPQLTKRSSPYIAPSMSMATLASLSATRLRSLGGGVREVARSRERGPRSRLGNTAAGSCCQVLAAKFVIRQNHSGATHRGTEMSSHSSKDSSSLCRTRDTTAKCFPTANCRNCTPKALTAALR